jgi:hypothetical protein
MSETTATRTLVKSPPELWAECSDAASLGRHLPQFGEITITKLDPETSVAWEGERVSGTVRIEPSGWGTKVTFTATPESAHEVPGPEVEQPEVAPEPEAPAQEPVATVEPEAAVKPEPAVEPEAAVEPEPAVEPEAAVEPEPVPAAPAPERRDVPTPPPTRDGFFVRLLTRMGFRPAPALASPASTKPPPAVGREPAPVAPAPVPEPEPVVAAPEPESEPPAPSPADELAEIEAALTAALESLGQAHHRPFSRA